MPFYTVCDAIDEICKDFEYALMEGELPGLAELSFSDARKAAVIASTLLRRWMIDLCGFQQPVQIWAASPNGSLVRLTHAIFVSWDHVSWYEFRWPQTADAELGLLLSAKDMTPKGINERFRYDLIDEATWLINLAKDPRNEGGPEDDGEYAETPHTKKIRAAHMNFDGWALCVKEADYSHLIEKIYQEYEKAVGLSEPPVRGGRPRKREDILSAYFRVYPDGHSPDVAWKVVHGAVRQALGAEFHITTLQNAIRDMKKKPAE